MTRFIFLLLTAVFFAPAAFAEAMSPGAFVVSADTLNVRLAANTAGKVSGKLYRGQRVEVFEVANGWARVSEYFDGATEGLSGSVARWVFALHLSDTTGAAEATIEDTPGEMFFVNTGSLNVRLAANKKGNVASKLHRGQEVEVFEVNQGWARISKYYDGEVESLTGKVARWVYAQHLSAKPRIRVKIDVNSPVARAIEASDDLDKHQHTFVWASEKLVDSGECDLSDFQDIGGWWRSAAHKPRPIYYTYCGGATNSHRIYLDASSGQTFR